MRIFFSSLFIFFVLSPRTAICNDTTKCLFAVVLNNKWGFIDNNQVLKISYQFDSVGYFSENLALAKVDSLWGYINDRGVFVIKPQFKYAESFSCGLAKVNSTESRYPTVFINRSGAVAFKSKINEVSSFRFNRARVRVKNRIGFINTKGRLIIRTSFPYGDEFYDGVAQVWSANTAEYIDTLGKRIAYFKEMGHQSFSEGVASVLGNDNTSYLDKFGNKIEIHRRSFYIDKYGRPKITNTVDSLVYFSFHSGMAEVCIPGAGHKSGFIDSSGRVVVPVIYDEVNNFFGEYATVYKEGKGSIINKRGEIVADIKDYEKYFPKYICY
ncbi:MAG: WG repeat-containing protein [Sphingobacteriales bacterium]|nr:MAG: WG repeat-containing protein [Sphingobacteriales bacterium]